VFDFDELFKERFNKKIFLILMLVGVVGFYMYDLMFGKRSFSQLLDVQSSLQTLNKSVIHLKKENERLQKEYFELKELEGG